MARTIHESIAGIDLFVPTANDFFQTSAVSGVFLPNGDPCLTITPGDSRAFAPAPTLVPNVLKKAGQGPYAISFWVKTAGIENGKSTEFGVQTIGAGSFGGAYNEYPWRMQIQTHTSGLAGVTFYQYVGTGFSYSQFNMSAAANTNWQFFVFNINTPGNPSTGYKNTDTSLTSLGNTSAGTNDFAADLYFCIGRYGNSAPGNTGTNNKHLGKIVIHDHMLSLTECQMLYLSMTT